MACSCFDGDLRKCNQRGCDTTLQRRTAARQTKLSVRDKRYLRDESLLLDLPVPSGWISSVRSLDVQSEFGNA